MSSHILAKKVVIEDYLPETRHGVEAFRSVVVVGLGYVGLPTAAMFARSGLQVVGVDVNEKTVHCVNRGAAHIVEEGLDALVSLAVSGGALRATLRPEPGDAFIIAVPTPFAEGHVPDLCHVRAAVHSIAPVLTRGNLVVLESTSPVGTTRQVAEWLAELRRDLTFPHQDEEAADVQVAYCPERVLPGRTLQELVQNDRIIGGMTPRCAERAAALYRHFVAGECVRTSAATAEMTKLAENAFRDLNIAFANEMSLICDKLGIDVWEMIELANRHPRVRILRPGPGVGGHCIAVDPWFIVHSAAEEARLLRTARQVNDAMPARVVARVKERAALLPDPVIACCGLSYKPDIDDLRESPAVQVVRMLAEQRVGRLLVVEPHIDRLPRELAHLPVRLTELSSALEQADLLVLLVDHRAFREVGPRALQGKLLVDTQGCWQPRSSAPVPDGARVPEREVAR